jgi:diketogulonate reductase-like aldo/keto reductase
MTPAESLRDTMIPLKYGSGSVPALAFGTLIPDPLATAEAVRAALRAGFRHFDCSERYGNESVVGDVMREAFDDGTAYRETVFMTTKLWNNNHRPNRVRPAFEASRARLRLESIDCYLIHTPFAFRPGDEQDPRDASGQVQYDPGVKLTETWRAMEALVDEGRCKSIGLSNVSLLQAQEIFDSARIKPAIVQVESHPYLPQWDLLEYCRRQGIALMAFAALGHGMVPRVLDDPVIVAIAQDIHKTAAQVLLAWAVQRGTVAVTTSIKVRRIEENFDIRALPEDAMQRIRDAVTARVRFNAVVQGGVPGFIPRGA